MEQIGILSSLKLLALSCHEGEFTLNNKFPFHNSFVMFKILNKYRYMPSYIRQEYKHEYSLTV